MSIKFFTDIDINGYSFYKNQDKELVLSNDGTDIVSFSTDNFGMNEVNVNETYTVNIGYQAGLVNQGNRSVALGSGTGYQNQGATSVAIGNNAGQNNQGLGTIAIGNQAAQFHQATFAVAIGYQAGHQNQGTNAIAIGQGAGQSNQNTNSIVINATGNPLNTVGSGFYVAPIAPIAQTNNTSNILVYNLDTKEVCYSTLLNTILNRLSALEAK